MSVRKWMSPLQKEKSLRSKKQNMLQHSMKMSGMHGGKIGIDDDEKGRDYIYGEKKKIYVRGLINLDKPWCNMHNQWAYTYTNW